MYTLVLYDISNNKLRNIAAETCKDYGLERIQWSAFLGYLSRNRREELFHKLTQIVSQRQEDACVHLFVICEKDIVQNMVFKVKGEAAG